MSSNRAQAWNALLCPPLGFGLNLLLLWLILRRTPKEMMVHSRVLLQTCLIDCLILVIQTFVQQIVIYYEQGHQFVAFSDGYLIRLFRTAFQMPQLLISLHMLWLFSTHVSIFGISVQFLYRYLVLVRTKNVTLGQYLLMLAGPILCTGIVTTGLCYDAYQTMIVSPSLSAADMARFTTIVDFGEQPLIVTASFDVLAHYSYALLALMYACSYTVIFLCGRKIIRFVSQHATFNGRLKELNRQLTRTLILLALFPLLLQLIALLLLVNVFYDFASVEFTFYSFFVFHWIPLLNPVVSILTNRPYREAVTRKLCPCSNSNNTTITVVTPIAANDVT